MWPSQGHGDSPRRACPRITVRGRESHSLATHIRRHLGDLVIERMSDGSQSSTTRSSAHSRFRLSSGMTRESPSPFDRLRTGIMGPGTGFLDVTGRDEGTWDGVRTAMPHGSTPASGSRLERHKSSGRSPSSWESPKYRGVSCGHSIQSDAPSPALPDSSPSTGPRRERIESLPRTRYGGEGDSPPNHANHGQIPPNYSSDNPPCLTPVPPSWDRMNVRYQCRTEAAHSRRHRPRDGRRRPTRHRVPRRRHAGQERRLQVPCHRIAAAKELDNTHRPSDEQPGSVPSTA